MAPASPTRNYAIIIDAGSSGSRSQIYSWELGRRGDAQYAHALLPNVELGLGRGAPGDTLGDTPSPSGWKVEPGLSALSPTASTLELYLRQLIQPALALLPPSARPTTPVYVLATAGMRLLAPQQAHALLSSADDALAAILPHHRAHLSSRIISGEEEGFFGWLAVNYLMDGFVDRHGRQPQLQSPAHSHSWGFLDMGGASTQIAFEPTRGWGGDVAREKDDGLIDFNLRMSDGTHRPYTVFVATWLGYGTNQARDRHVRHLIKQKESDNESDTNKINSISYTDTVADAEAPDDDDSLHIPSTQAPQLTIEDPCLPRNLDVVDVYTSHNIHGTGSFTGCLRALEPLLEREAFCPHPPCLFGGQRVPPIDFSLDRFVGVSEYWFSSEHLFGLGGAWDLVRFERAAEEYCAQDWHALEREWKQGNVTGTSGKWGDQIDLPRLRMQCFKASWIVEVLHQGIGIPRIVDPGGNITTADPLTEANEKAGQKGLRYGEGEREQEQAPSHAPSHEPIFQSVNAIDSVPISWTLGSVLLTASGSQSPFLAYSTNTPHSTSDDIFTFTGVNGKLLALESRTGVRAVYVLAALALLLLAVGWYAWYVYRRRSRRRRDSDSDSNVQRYTAIPTQMEEGTEAISLNDVGHKAYSHKSRSGSGSSLGSLASVGSRGAAAIGKLQRSVRRLARSMPGWSWSWRDWTKPSAPRSRTPKLRYSGGLPSDPTSQPLQHTSSSPAIMTIKSAPSTPKRGSSRLHAYKNSQNVDVDVGGVGSGGVDAGVGVSGSAINDKSTNTKKQPHATGLGLFRNSLDRSSSSVHVDQLGFQQQQQQQQQHPSSQLQLNPPQTLASHPSNPSHPSHTPPRASLSSRNNSSANLTTLVSRSTSSAKLNNMGIVQDDYFV
ncbi:hypothetical protein E3P89_02936 [Wallemia ichthyophaga]|uniref:Golgi apyrase n=1 Tax=Wallemia ichthyophaga TaxID=245174 RepID=A0A4T0H933_WALIC|nr:hypothetical protein E3P90_03548 [Wallemia ichthyophaga]TIB10185.1 hypothetical protein E3P93_02961 [Wallemia ichthyophaga]TIB20878.1 hypothetical protein E3P89_02936 [Wallemia ichthyophaga]TIB21267.1 hypothetical protein E3P88_03562 [Wallemia ichthyophaga]